MNISITAWRDHIGRLVVITLGAAALLFAGLYTAGSSNAWPYPPTQSCGIVSDTTSVTPGESVTLTGSGFGGNTNVGLSIESTPHSLGSVQTDSTGAFRDTVTLPTDLVAGQHTIIASSPDQTCSLGLTAQTHAISAVQTSAPTSDGGSGVLASTGVQIAGISTIAVLLLGGGALLLLVGRRRKA
jgi:hypothetical protein